VTQKAFATSPSSTASTASTTAPAARNAASYEAAVITVSRSNRLCGSSGLLLEPGAAAAAKAAAAEAAAAASSLRSFSHCSSSLAEILKSQSAIVCSLYKVTAVRLFENGFHAM